MRTFTFGQNLLSPGFKLDHTANLGPVVFLGKKGRGHAHVTIPFDPCDRPREEDVVNGVLLDCRITTIAPESGSSNQSDRVFAFSRGGESSKSVCVRVNTHCKHSRCQGGHWRWHRGGSDVVIAYGKDTDAGKLEEWQDGIVIMQPGDVLQVNLEEVDTAERYALFLDGGEVVAMPWDDWAKQEAFRLAYENKTQIICGPLPTFTLDYQDSMFRPGIVHIEITGKSAVIVGRTGLAEREEVVPIVGKKLSAGQLLGAALGKAGGQWVLVAEEPAEHELALLVRVSVVGGGRRLYYHCQRLQGDPLLVAEGRIAIRGSSRLASGPDTLWVLGPGDAIVLASHARSKEARFEVIENRSGMPTLTSWSDWQTKNAPAALPDAFARKEEGAALETGC